MSSWNVVDPRDLLCGWTTRNGACMASAQSNGVCLAHQVRRPPLGVRASATLFLVERATVEEAELSLRRRKRCKQACRRATSARA